LVHRAVLDLPVEHEQLPFRSRVELAVDHHLRAFRNAQTEVDAKD
jgi:hypothetical protein